MRSSEGLARRAADRLRGSPRLYWTARTAYTALNRVLPPLRVDGVPGPIHRNDLMLTKASRASRELYLQAGLVAVELVEEAFASSGRSLAESAVLDFGCGHGRVTRHFAARAKSVTACDLDREGVRFCERAFGAVPLPGSLDIGEVPLRSYDAIWMGSVVTHHAPEPVEHLVEELAGHLEPGGVLVATSNSVDTLAVMLDDPSFRWLHSHRESLESELATAGAAYIRYPQNTDGLYGLGFQEDSWLDRVVGRAGLVPLWHRPGSWGGQVAHAWRR